MFETAPRRALGELDATLGVRVVPFFKRRASGVPLERTREMPRLNSRAIENRKQPLHRSVATHHLRHRISDLGLREPVGGQRRGD
jgi:hypothetical protein